MASLIVANCEAVFRLTKRVIRPSEPARITKMHLQNPRLIGKRVGLISLLREFESNESNEDASPRAVVPSTQGASCTAALHHTALRRAFARRTSGSSLVQIIASQNRGARRGMPSRYRGAARQWLGHNLPAPWLCYTITGHW